MSVPQLLKWWLAKADFKNGNHGVVTKLFEFGGSLIYIDFNKSKKGLKGCLKNI